MSEPSELDKGYQMPTTATPDEDLIQIDVDWEKECQDFHSHLERIWEVNEGYYAGKQTDIDRIPRNMSNAVQNHIFMGVETVIPIITANPPQFIAEPPEESDLSVERAENIQKALGIIYEEKDIRTKGEALMRHTILNRYGVFKPVFDPETGEVDVKSVRPHRIYFPKNGELLYVREKLDITREEFEETFGADKFQEFLKNKGADETKKIKGLYTVWEVRTPKMVFWRSGSYIIDKRESEYYDFKNKKKNHFSEPKIPYIISSAFRFGLSPVGETDLIQQCIPIQDVINVTNRLIINNATKLGNGMVLVDSQVMSEEEARGKITNSPGLILYGNNIANPNMFRRDVPPPLPNYIPELKIMAERAFDNIFGTHSTTRGERGQEETLGGRLLLKQADYGRIDLFVREYERVIAELGNWFVQMMKMNLKKPKTFRSYGESGAEFVRIESSMIENNLKVIIKSGTTLPTDEMSKRREAMELASLGLLDPVTLFERLKFPNPEEAAQRLLGWKQGQIQMEAQAQGTPAQQPQRGAKPLMNPRGEIGKAQQKVTQ